MPFDSKIRAPSDFMQVSLANIVFSVTCGVFILADIHTFLSYIFLAISVPAIIYLYSEKEYAKAFVILCLGSIFSSGTFTIWAGLHGLFFLPILVILVAAHPKGLSINALLSVLLVNSFYISASILTSGFEAANFLRYFLIDAFILNTIVLAFFAFRGLEAWHSTSIISSFYTLARIFIVKIFFAHLLSSFNESLYRPWSGNVLNASDELHIIYLLTLMLFILFGPSIKRIEALFFSSLLIWVFLKSGFKLDYLGMGSQTIIFIGLGATILGIRHFMKTLIKEPMKAIFLLFFIVSISVTVSIDAPRKFLDTAKFSNIAILVESLEGTDVLEMPHTINVRVAEFDAIASRPIEFILGSGFGGTIPLQKFGDIVLSTDDFSADQLNQKTVFTPHNLNYSLLKFGLVGLMGFFLYCSSVLYSAKRNIDDLNRSFLLIVLLVLIANLGTSFKVPAVLGFLLAALANSSGYNPGKLLKNG